jgi:hypothetical protein
VELGEGGEQPACDDSGALLGQVDRVAEHVDVGRVDLVAYEGVEVG